MIIEAIILSYLPEKLEVPVYTEVPSNPPKRFVVIDKTGSSKENKVTTSTVALQSYAESLYEAAVLNESVKSHMENIVILKNIFDSSIENDYNYTDSSTKRYRYQAVFDLVHF